MASQHTNDCVKLSHFSSQIPGCKSHHRSPYFTGDFDVQRSTSILETKQDAAIIVKPNVNFILPGSEEATLPPTHLQPQTTTKLPTSHHQKPGSTAFILPCTNSARQLPSQEQALTGTFTCKTCSRTFTEFEILVYHMFSTHVTDRPAPCRTVKTSCRISPYPSHRPVTMNRFTCNFCDLKFSSHYLFKRHNIETHQKYIKHVV